MVIKNYFSLFMLMVVLPVFVVCVNPDAFFILISMLILFVSSQSLKKLIIVNFGSDDMYFRMEENINRAKTHITQKNIKLTRTMVFLLNILFIMFFVYTYFLGNNPVLKLISVIITADWIYDLLKTFSNYAGDANAENNDSWTFKDNLSEAFVWFHNISSIAFVIIMFGVKFF